MEALFYPDRNVNGFGYLYYRARTRGISMAHWFFGSIAQAKSYSRTFSLRFRSFGCKRPFRSKIPGKRHHFPIVSKATQIDDKFLLGNLCFVFFFFFFLSFRNINASNFEAGAVRGPIFWLYLDTRRDLSVQMLG